MTGTTTETDGGQLPDAIGSAIMEMPGDIRVAVMKVLGRPRYLARVLREESKSADEWANAHADKESYSHRVNADGSPMTKHDVYAAKAKMFRAAADIFDPPNDKVQP